MNTPTRTIRDSRLASLTLAATLGLLAGTSWAFACDTPTSQTVSARAGAQDDPGVRFVRVAQQEPGRNSTTINTAATRTFVWSDGSDDVRVSVEGQKITAHLNGEKVIDLEGLESSSSDIERNGDRLSVSAEDGEVRIEFNGDEIGRIDTVARDRESDGENQERLERRIEGRVQAMRREAERMAEQFRNSAGAWSSRGGPSVAWAGPGMGPPKVMLGVTLAEPDDEDLAQGQSAESTTLITSVSDGLPAEKAGLKENDLIVKIDGSDNASPRALREMLRTKNPGDVVTLTIVRRDESGDRQTKELPVTLDAYDPEKIGFSGTITNNFFGNDEMERKLEALQTKLAAHSEQMEVLAAELSKNIASEARGAAVAKMSELGEEMSRLGAEIARESAQFRPFSVFGRDAEGQSALGALPRVYIDREGRSGQAFIFPVPPPAVAPAPAPVPDVAGTAGGPASGPSNEEINRRLDRLERMLEKLVEKKAEEGR